jgi:hypothetical protein
VCEDQSHRPAGKLGLASRSATRDDVPGSSLDPIEAAQIGAHVPLHAGPWVKIKLSLSNQCFAYHCLLRYAAARPQGLNGLPTVQ